MVVTWAQVYNLPDQVRRVHAVTFFMDVGF